MEPGFPTNGHGTELREDLPTRRVLLPLSVFLSISRPAISLTASRPSFLDSNGDDLRSVAPGAAAGKRYLEEGMKGLPEP